jgi:hypothetical protein
MLINLQLCPFCSSSLRLAGLFVWIPLTDSVGLTGTDAKEKPVTPVTFVIAPVT